MWAKHYVDVCLVAFVVFVFTGTSIGAPTKGCKKSFTSLSQEAGLEAQALIDPDENGVYHANSIEDIALIKKKSKVEEKKLQSDDDNCGDSEIGMKKGNVEHQNVKPIAKSDIINSDTKEKGSKNFEESIQIDEDENNNKNVKKSNPSLVESLVEQKGKIQDLQKSIHKNLIKLFHHLRHSHTQNTLADREEVSQAKEALIADAKKMTALDHDPSPAENFLKGLGNNMLISKMLKNKDKPSVVSLDSTPESNSTTRTTTDNKDTNTGGNNVSEEGNASKSNAKPNVEENESFELKTSGETKPVGGENSNVEVKTSGEAKTSEETKSLGGENFSVEVKTSGEAKTSEKTKPVGGESSSFEVKTSGEAKTSEEAKPLGGENSSVEVKTSGEVKAIGGGNTNIEVKPSSDKEHSGSIFSDMNSIDTALKSSTTKRKGNESSLNNGNDTKVTTSDDNSKASLNFSSSAKLGKLNLAGNKQGNVTKIKIKEAKDEKINKIKVKHDPYAEIAASPDNPKMPPNIKLPKEGPYIPVGLAKPPDDVDDDPDAENEPSRDKGKGEKDRDEGRGGGGGAFIPPLPPGDLAGQSEAPGQSDLTMAGTVNPDLANQGIMNSLRNEAVQEQLQDQIQQQAMEGQMMHGINGIAGKGRTAGGFGDSEDTMGGMGGMGAMGALGGMGAMGAMGALGGMGAVGGIGGMGAMEGMVGMADAGGMDGTRMAAMGGIGGMGDMPGGMGDMPGGMGDIGGMGYVRSPAEYEDMNGMGRIPMMEGDMEYDNGPFDRDQAYGRSFMEDEPSDDRYGSEEEPREPPMMDQTAVGRNTVPSRYPRPSGYRPLYNPRYFDDDDDDDEPYHDDDSEEVAGSQRDRAPEPQRYEDLEANYSDLDDGYDPEDERKTKIAKVQKLTKKIQKNH